MKNCHGRSESGVGCVGDKGLVEVFELAVEPGLQRGVADRCGDRQTRLFTLRVATIFLIANTRATAPNQGMA